MKILFQQFLNKNHSWAMVGRGLATSYIEQGHNVHLFSTDGGDSIPENLKNNLIGYTDNNLNKISGRLPDKDYDMQISYTAMKNFPIYLSHGNNNRFGIWCYEWQGINILPTGFAKNYQRCDQLIAPSNFAKEVFLQSKIPENRITVIPHGVDESYIASNSKLQLSNKKFKILANIAQNHIRKNIPGLLEAYGKAFDKNDDVCLILKGKPKGISNQFDVDVNLIIKKFKEKYKNHAELIIYPNYLDDMSVLYRSIDAVFTMSHSECFYMPATEALVSGKLNICPRYGGQLDFLNDNNSLLIDGKVGRADPKSMYWESKNNAEWFIPSIDNAVEKLLYARDNFERLNSELEKNRQELYKSYSWDAVTQRFLELCK